MIDLSAILQHIKNIIGSTKKFGIYYPDNVVEEWAWKNFCVIEHVGLGQALYINEIQVWNNW